MNTERELDEVALRVATALEEDMPAELGDRRDRLCRQIRSIGERAMFTAPELMRDRWLQFCDAFNAGVFGTSERSRWHRKDVPTWAERAASILEGRDG